MSAVLAEEDETAVEQLDPILGELDTNPDAPIIDTSGETEDAAASDAGESAGTQPDGISDDWRAIAKDYHLDDAAIDKFGTADELAHHLRALDQMQQQGWQAPQQVAPQPTQSAPKSEAMESLDLELGDLDADDPVRKSLEKVKAYLTAQEEKHAQFEAYQQQQREQQFAQHLGSELDKALDEFKSPSFGKSGEMLGAQWRNRERVYKAYEWAVYDSLKRGQQPDYASLAKNAANVLFPKQFEQQLQQKTTAVIAKRSSQRTGAGSRGPKVEKTLPYKDSPAYDDAHARFLRGE